MVAYIKNTFLLVSVIVLSLFVFSSYARFSMMVTKDEINRICTKGSVNATLCFEFVKRTPEFAKLDPFGLAKFLINYDSQKSSVTLRQFQSLQNSTTDLGAKGAYRVCSETFDAAIGSFGSALKVLEAKDYDGLSSQVGSTIDMVVTCRDELITVKPSRSKLLSELSFIQNLSSMVLVILECFLREKKTLC